MTTSRTRTTTTADGTAEASSAQTTRRAARARRATADDATVMSPGRNEVHLSGRLAADAQERELPSGDRIVTLRIVVARSQAAGRSRQNAEGPRRATVDTIDVVCWTAGTRRTALRLRADEPLEVEGALRRRFFGGPTGRQSRYEVEASALRRVSGGRAVGT